MTDVIEPELAPYRDGSLPDRGVLKSYDGTALLVDRAGTRIGWRDNRGEESWHRLADPDRAPGEGKVAEVAFVTFYPVNRAGYVATRHQGRILFVDGTGACVWASPRFLADTFAVLWSPDRIRALGGLSGVECHAVAVADVNALQERYPGSAPVSGMPAGRVYLLAALVTLLVLAAVVIGAWISTH